MRKKKKKRLYPQKMDADLFRFVEDDIRRMKTLEMFSSAENLRTALNRLKRFLSVSSYPFHKLDTRQVKSYEQYLKMKDLMASSISLDMRVLSASYNRAVEAGVANGPNPFADVRKGNVYYRQPALSRAEMKLLIEAEVTQGGWAELSHDMMCLSYEFCGMPPVDIIFLKWSQINFDTGTLNYSRHKTRVKGTVAISPKAKKILLKYRARKHQGREKLGYVFPIITTADNEQAFNQYKSALRQINRSLCQLGRRCGLRYRLSTYVIRRTWATIARNEFGAQTNVISLALCHTSERTTSLYISRIDDGKLFELQKLMGKASRKPPIMNRDTIL